MNTIIISIACSVIASVIYGFLIRKNEERIIAWISSLRHGWIRTRFILAHTGAIRGKARSSDTERINYIVLLFPIVLAWYSATGAIEIRQFLDRIQEPKPVVTAEAELGKEIEEHIRSGEKFITISYTFSGICSAWYAVMVLIIIPFRALRSRISFEINRFNGYLVGLATKEEIKEIMLAEQKVVSEETLQSYYRLLIQIAKRHGVECYARPLWIWDDDYDIKSSNDAIHSTETSSAE